jgi:LAS superfamily LD-carboxypeptidase LdcB
VETPKRHPYIAPITTGFVVLILLLGSGYLYTLYSKTTSEKNNLSSNLSDTQKERDEKATRIAELEGQVASLTENLKMTTEALDNTKTELEEKADEVDQFAKQIKKISGTVGVLDKLSKTDPELLIKYSKVYFLNENYKPEKLSLIDEKYNAVTSEQYLETRVYEKLKDMIEDAKDDDIDLKVRSAYRSFEAQKNLKSAYSVSYGSGANTFSADQGYSEHQLGTTIDLTSSEVGNQLAGFDTTQAYAWLQKNAYKYGFVLSYPKDNAFYIFEPWHWRYVGTDLASDLRDDNKFFYDLDQREIDKYLVSIFD